MMDKKSFSKKWPLRGCEIPCENPKHNHTSDCRPCLCHEFIPCKAQLERITLPQHTKMFLRESTLPGPFCGRGWIYAGSANLSGSAWGNMKKLKDKVENRVNHYELGVLLTDVVISKFDAIIPWERRKFPGGRGVDSHRYDRSTSQEPWGEKR